MQHQTDNRSSPTTAFKPTRPARRSHARKHLAPNKCMALVPAARRSPVIIEASHAALPFPLLSSTSEQQPSQQVKNPEHLLWPPGSPSAYKNPSRLLPLASRSCRRPRGDGAESDRPPWEELRAATARGSRRDSGRWRRTSCSSTTSRPTAPEIGACSPSSRVRTYVRALFLGRARPGRLVLHA